jgi:hypothetical protein
MDCRKPQQILHFLVILNMVAQLFDSADGIIGKTTVHILSLKDLYSFSDNDVPLHQ